MAKPPESGPHSDIDGVNRDARVGQQDGTGKPNPGAAIDNAKDEGTARPEEGATPAAGRSGKGA